ncbi:MAG: 3-hydroxyacyl-CoA dehydrogenase family protein [Deltaproteobacteria bacterium]|nr:3-hydroxyacyl-CoA dehydrogenase family protein [Deltaproteobacteria bacterium]
MDLDSSLTSVSVLGAAGKMGSGIALLVAQEMARLSLLPQHRDKVFRLNAIDLDAKGLRGLQQYIHDQALKAAEKAAVELRGLYAERADLVDNRDMIAEFTERVQSMLWPSTELGAARGSLLVFEAIVEKIPVKVSVLRQTKELCPADACFFTNTSSVPIGLLDREAGLGGRLLGVHFYNPPAVQKLVEIIRAESTREEVAAAAAEMCKRLRKTVIPSRDVAGFIGNGHFIRDGLHGLRSSERLAAEHGWPKALHMVNRVSQDWLLRPMGIFQLVDYVGIDVFKLIQDVMEQHLKEGLGHPVIDELVRRGVLGGQNPDGSQKPGFLRYERGKPSAVYDLDKREYVALDPQGWTGEADRQLGPLPAGFRPWKALVGVPDREAALRRHFELLAAGGGPGAELARSYVRRSREIGLGLVERGVAAKAEDVNGVLTSGFFHLYGPINDYCR